MATLAQYQQLQAFLAVAVTQNVTYFTNLQCKNMLDAVNTVVASMTKPQDGELDFSDPSNADNNSLL